MKTILHNIYYQYSIGLALNFFVLIVLYSCSQSYKNTQLPCGIHKNNIWADSDINDYVSSGINYVRCGVFGVEGKPDHLRTVGYPAIIAAYYSIFGTRWLIALQISQCLLFAFMYPIITLLSKEIFPHISNQAISAIFIFLVLSGIYWARSIMVLTDTIFAVLFTTGFYFGVKTFRSTSLIYALLYIVFITAAGLIRPTLFMFPLLNITLAFFVAKQYRLAMLKVFPVAIFTTLLFSVTCNLASVRNYTNYSFLSPSSVVGLNAFRSVAQKVLVASGNTDEYLKDADQLSRIEDISAKTEMRKEIMLNAIFQHPVQTAVMVEKNAVNVFLDNHAVNNLANYFDYNWKTFGSTSSSFASGYPYKKSVFCFYLTYAFMGLYFVVWLLFFHFCYTALVNAQYEYLYLIGSLMFVFILPAIIIGDGGSRLRLPFEPFLVLVAIYHASQLLNPKRKLTIASPKIKEPEAAELVY